MRKIKSQLKTRYFWPIKQTFFSMCFKHYEQELGCWKCQNGHWVFNLSTRLNAMLYEISPKLWSLWLATKTNLWRIIHRE